MGRSGLTRRADPAGRRRPRARLLAVVPANCRFEHMAVNQRLRALIEISDIDILAGYPASFPADIAAHARIRSFPGARRPLPATVKVPLFAAYVAIWATAKRLAGRGYELVYTFQDVSAVAGWLLAPRSGRWAMDVLDDPGQSHGNAAQRGQSLKSGLLRLYERIIGFFLRRADIVFTIGLIHDDPLPRTLSQDYGVASDRIFPLRQSIDVPLIRDTFGRTTPAEASVPQVSFVGYVSRLRGVDTLIGAANILRDRGLEFELILVGHLNKKDAEWLTAVQLSLPNLRYLGVLPSSQTLRAMSTVTVGVLPFPYRRETAPVQAVTGIEYLALGRPIVATDLPGAHALIDDYVNGILVPPGDTEAMARAIEEIVTNPDLTKEMGEASMKKAEMFDARLIRKEVIHVLHNS